MNVARRIRMLLTAANPEGLDWWGGLDLQARRNYLHAHPGSKFSKQTWNLPPEPGTTPIPEGHVRLYHQTREDNLGAIKHQGIRHDRARGIEGPRAVYADEQGFYDKPGQTPTVEFHVPRERWNKPFVRTHLDEDQNRVAPENIIAIHHMWHNNARYAESDPDIVKAIVNGEHDDLLNDKEYGKAIRYIKHKYGTVK